MVRLSGKPSVFCVDGLNFIRSYVMAGGGYKTDDECAAALLDWLESVSCTDRFKNAEFRVVFDGGYRSVGPLVRGRVHAQFSDSDSADDILLEQAAYLKDHSTLKVWLVTSDGALVSIARENGIKTIYCPTFHELAQAALDAESR
ncbi:MAG: NYN domain-containing protein [Elusimicrobiaceae bacterium]|nr:NYN domain-containing protein [Elusimicrobiaceae bacterium]